MTDVLDLAADHARRAAPPNGWRLGLIGNPVAHSLSPAMQNAALRDLSITGTYERWQTAETEVAERVARLRAPDVLGANVTVPHKQAVVGELDDVTPLADRVGAVNTILHRDGRLVGDNTDVYGFVTALAAVTGDLTGRTALILGAGGASRAVVIGLERMGLGRIIIANRNPDRATSLIEELRCPVATPAAMDERALKEVLPTVTVLVNATALGWHAGETPIPLDLLATLPGDAHVTDLTYRDTDLLIAARGRGLTATDGLEMLILQGARSLQLWTGLEPPLATMRAAALAARG